MTPAFYSPPKYYYNEYIQLGFRVTTHLKNMAEKREKRSEKKRDKSKTNVASLM